MKKKIIIRIIIVISILIFAIIQIMECRKILNKSLANFEKSVAEDLPTSMALSTKYASIIKEKYNEKYTINIIRNAKNRNQVASLNLNNKFDIIIVEINLINPSSLANIINYSEHISATKEVGVPYNVTHSGPYEWMNRTEKLTSVSEVFLGYNASNITSIVANDSISSFSLVTNNCSIRYRLQDPADIIIATKPVVFEIAFSMKFSFLFLRRDSSLFFLTLTARNGKDQIPENLLFNIVTNQ